MMREPIEGREPIELPSNDGRVRVVFELLPKSPQQLVRPGALSIRKSYWDRIMLLNGQYSQAVPDARVELLQLLFADESLRRLATEMLRWSELDFSILTHQPLTLEIDLLFESVHGTWLTMALGPHADHPRGDRIECRISYADESLWDRHEGSFTFQVDVSGAHRFATELLAALDT